jgi:hypothetical protein
VTYENRSLVGRMVWHEIAKRNSEDLLADSQQVVSVPITKISFPPSSVLHEYHEFSGLRVFGELEGSVFTLSAGRQIAGGQDQVSFESIART